MVQPPRLKRSSGSRPWYLYGLIFLAALLASVLVYGSTRAHIIERGASADARERADFQRLSLRIDDFTKDAAQLVSAAASGPCAVARDQELAHRLLVGLLRSRLNEQVYGIGCFFEPRALDGHPHLHGPYVRYDGAHIKYVPNDNGTYRYTSLAWYKYGLSLGTRIAPYGPYRDGGLLFVSFLRGFWVGGHVAGVASVDALEDTFTKIAAPLFRPGEDGYIADSTGARVLKFGKPLPKGAPVVELTGPITYSHAMLHLESDRSRLEAENRVILLSAAVQLALIWLTAVVAGLLLSRFIRMQNAMSTQRELEAHLRRAAYVDVLTGLSNRAFILDSIATVLSEKRTARLFFIDLDSFSLINDTLGHESGDEFLIALAGRLRTAFPRAIVARTGGDEFVVLDDDLAVTIAQGSRTLREVFEHPASVRGRPTHGTASFGIVEIDATYERAVDALRDAEIAMYHAKGATRGGGSLFNVVMRRQLEGEAELERDLLRAIREDEFIAHYQPIIDLKTRRIKSVEALARWNRPNHGLTDPLGFIPFAEAHGLVSAIDALVLKRACSEMPQLLSALPTLNVAVNCSMAQLTGSDLVGFVHEQLTKYEIPAAHLKLEITETSVMRNAESALASLERLRALGVLAVVDDFGTGYSSLSYLQRLPITGVKIDRSFITPLEESAQAKAIVRGVIALADTLGLYTVAEGVETAGQLAVLDQLGATYVQGFFFSKPLSLHDILALLQAEYSKASIS